MPKIQDVGFWREMFSLGEVVSSVADAPAPTFAVDAESVGPSVVGLGSYATPVTPAARVDRRSALQVPAVKRSRDLIVSTLGGLPIDLYNADREPVESALFDQPERNVPRSITMTRTFEDMLFEGRAWWRVTERAWDKYPAYVKYVPNGKVTVDDDRDIVYIDGKPVPNADLIRFDSPNEPLLIAGARAIRTCLALDAYASNAAQGIPPMDYFTPEDGDVDPFDDPDDLSIENPYTAKDFLADWAAARREGSTAWIPRAVKYNANGFDPKNLQLAEQRQHAVLEIARVAGVDPEELGVSTTSRTYANQFERRKAFTDFTLGPYRQAFEDRARMGDVTKRGYYVKFNLDAFLRSDPLARYQAYAAGKAVGALDDDDIARLEDKPLGSVRPAATVTALPTPPQQEETA